MLELNNISKTFSQRKILDNISIKIKTNTITGLVGSNGVGKTTLFNIILGLVKPDKYEKNQIILNNQDISKLPTYKRIRAGLGYMSQTSSAITDLTIEDNIYLIPKRHEDDFENRENLLNQFSLEHIRKQKCKTLSGGELRKLEFCLCMATRPKLILLDEPFEGLDPKTTKIVLSTIIELHKENMGFIIVDHRIEELQRVAEEYILLNNRAVVFQGESTNFYIDELVNEIFLGENLILS
jgi:lipopolysaccharide export system ATP-binding protein